MLYTLLRTVSRIALSWLYRDIEVAGRERIPREGPLLVAVNHPNSLIDALVAGCVVPRRLLLTAKATLWENFFFRHLVRRAGIVPMRRASDELSEQQPAPGGDALRGVDASRNESTFRAILDALARGSAILIFPEGKSHGEPALAPLKTGLARIALQARDERGIRGLRIVPIGLTFERKWAPRTRIFVQVGEPIAVDDWRVAPGAASDGADPVRALTREVEECLRATTLNFPSAEEAARVRGVARILARVFDRTRPLGAPDPPLADEMTLVRRVDAVQGRVRAAAPERATRFLEHLETLRAELAAREIPVNDVGISRSVASAAWFTLREGAIVAGAGPIAWWGRLNHWAPIRLARWVAHRRSTSPEDPAQYTLAVGLGLVLLAYAAQTAIVWRAFGPAWALPYLTSLPASATWDLRFRERMHRAARRVRTYLQFRSDPALQLRLESELAWLRAEAVELEVLGTRE
jgi:glycerol-3-phosphate O-acyltransferase/dihydroxyacetone phosphate acyltransferase